MGMMGQGILSNDGNVIYDGKITKLERKTKKLKKKRNSHT